MQRIEELQYALRAAGLNGAQLRPLSWAASSGVLVLPSAGGDAALHVWRQLRSRVPQTGYWPVLLGGGDEAAEVLVGPEWSELSGPDERDVASILEAAGRIDATRWFAERRTRRLDDFGEYNPGEDPANLFAPQGEWPVDAAPDNHFTTPFDIGTGKPHDHVAFGLEPAAVPWEVPAYLRLGGWNECPAAEVHCAVMRYWHGRYGAEVAAATGSVVEMQVARPPTDRESALALAHEQYTYCQDIVDQGTQTLATLAATLLGGTAWFFWWD